MANDHTDNTAAIWRQEEIDLSPAKATSVIETWNLGAAISISQIFQKFSQKKISWHMRCLLIASKLPTPEKLDRKSPGKRFSQKKKKISAMKIRKQDFQHCFNYSWLNSKRQECVNKGTVQASGNLIKMKLGFLQSVVLFELPSQLPEPLSLLVVFRNSRTV